MARYISKMLAGYKSTGLDLYVLVEIYLHKCAQMLVKDQGKIGNLFSELPD